ncbi:MAG: methylated-DNA--[protein]-cysteine S-methyltransferase [Alphaproteobacteria bacterium]|nr:methylated-DNA--[protein]-cysteine S-methyltransferase [Alphaproteobacteria bacterium]
MTSARFDSPVGRLVLTARDGALVSVAWAGTAAADEGADADDPVLREACGQLSAYFAGRLTRFDLPLAPAGTPFRQRVRAAMAAIPYGQTLTYGAIARALDTAPRAVGGACGANPLPIIIPCHRVVGGNGPGGYSGARGLATKHWLLAHEGAIVPLENKLSFSDNAGVESRLEPLRR